jgi:hypothetical protein
MAKPMMKPYGEFVILQFALQSGDLWPVAVLLLDAQDRLHILARPTADLTAKIPALDAEVVGGSFDQLSTDSQTMSGSEMLERLEGQLSNAIRISDRQQTELKSIEDTLNDLYRYHVASVE